MFIQQDGEWLEVQEHPTVRPEEPIILSPGNSSSTQIVAFSPQLNDPTQTYFMRLYVFGEMTTPEGTKEVAAFVDFVVKP